MRPLHPRPCYPGGRGQPHGNRSPSPSSQSPNSRSREPCECDSLQRHIRQFLDEYAPASPTETQLVHAIADTAWGLNRIPLLETALLSQTSDPQSLIPALATLSLHSSRLSRQFEKAIRHLRDIQDERHHLERRQLTEAAELLIRYQHKGLPFDPARFSTGHGFVFSNEQIERRARDLILLNPAFYAPLAKSAAAGAASGV